MHSATRLCEGFPVSNSVGPRMRAPSSETDCESRHFSVAALNTLRDQTDWRREADSNHRFRECGHRHLRRYLRTMCWANATAL